MIIYYSPASARHYTMWDIAIKERLDPRIRIEENELDVVVDIEYGSALETIANKTQKIKLMKALEARTKHELLQTLFWGFGEGKLWSSM